MDSLGLTRARGEHLIERDEVGVIRNFDRANDEGVSEVVEGDLRLSCREKTGNDED